MNVLHERGLKLSRKKTRIGSIYDGFHFLGIYYPKTQSLDNTNVTHSCYAAKKPKKYDFDCNIKNEPTNIVPHPRTLRKAREQINIMVADGNSTQQIRNYLHLWVMWWVKTSELWDYHILLQWFIKACFENNPAKNYAVGLLKLSLNEKERKSKHAALGRDIPQAATFAPAI